MSCDRSSGLTALHDPRRIRGYSVLPMQPPPYGPPPPPLPPAYPPGVSPYGAAVGVWGGPTTSQERTWGLLGHLASLFMSIVGPLVVYVLKKDESKFVAFHALQQLIFDAILLPVILIIAVVTCGFGAVLVFVPLVFQIIAALRANDGEYYELPVAGAIARKSVYGA